MVLIIEAHERCKKCFHFQVCASVLKNDLLIREVMLEEKEPKCKSFVEVVRCKNCKYWDKKHGVCEYHTEADTVWVNADDFCSYGDWMDLIRVETSVSSFLCK